MHKGTLAVIALVAACGGADPGEDPVARTPLMGTLNGMPWVAGGAVVKENSDPGEKSVYMYPDANLTCTTFGAEPYVVAVMPWTAGGHPLGFHENAPTVFIYFDATAHVVLDGRIELDAAPVEVGATTTFRIRALFEDTDDDLNVEGEIQATICE
jgi:hypothetical protein